MGGNKHYTPPTYIPLNQSDAEVQQVSTVEENQQSKKDDHAQFYWTFLPLLPVWEKCRILGVGNLDGSCTTHFILWAFLNTICCFLTEGILLGLPGCFVACYACGYRKTLRSKYNLQVGIWYTAKLKENDKVFDSNIGKGDPLEFRIASGQLIKGWEIGVVGMCVVDKRRITIPPALGYGAKGHLVVVPPISWLVIEVELIYIRSYFVES